MAAPPATMHAKSDSDVTSFDQSTPPRSPRRPLYYVQSPSNHDVEKMSYGSSPMGSPHHHNYYHSSPIHHSRESSTSRFSASLKNPRSLSAWKKVQRGEESENDDDGNDVVSRGQGRNVKLYLCFALLFVVLFTLFSLILWGASKSYKPEVVVEVYIYYYYFFFLAFWFVFVKSEWTRLRIGSFTESTRFVFEIKSQSFWLLCTLKKQKWYLIKGMYVSFEQHIVFRRFDIQSGNDRTGVPTDMLTLNSTVRIVYRNPATFFGVHVTSTPLELHYYELKVASGEVCKVIQILIYYFNRIIRWIE